MRRIALLLLLAAGCGGKPVAAGPAAPAAAPAPSAAPGRPAVVARPAVPARSCGVESGILTGERVGAVRLGMPLDSVKLLCRVVRDTTEEMEGEPVRFLIIAVGSDTLRAEAQQDVVARVQVRSARFQTRDSVRVGVPVERLLRFKDVSAGHGEGDYFVISDAPTVCGLSFAVRFPRNADYARMDLERLRTLASTASVDWILVRGCRP